MVRPLRLLAGLATCVALATVAGAAAVALPPPPTTVDGRDDRRPRNPLVEEAQRSWEAVELFRAGERNSIPDPDLIGDRVAEPSARPVPDRLVAAAPRPGVGRSGWSTRAGRPWSGWTRTADPARGG